MLRNGSRVTTAANIPCRPTDARDCWGLFARKQLHLERVNFDSGVCEINDHPSSGGTPRARPPWTPISMLALGENAETSREWSFISHAGATPLGDTRQH